MRDGSEQGSGSKLDLATFRRGSDENNLAEFPLALLTDTVPEGQKTIEFQDTFTDWKTGQVLTRRVCISGSDKFGLPTAKDEDVLLALIQLTKIANNFTDPRVWFTKHQVIELLGWKNRGWAYDRVEESLLRWRGVSVYYWNAWRNHKSGTWDSTEAIGIIEYVRFEDARRKRSGDGTEAMSRFIWNSVLFESFRSGYLKPLDFESYRRLKKPASRRAYRFLDKQFFYGPKQEFDLDVLACEKLGFSRNYDVGQLKEKLRPVWGELEDLGYIDPVQYVKERPKRWKIAIQQKGAEPAGLVASSTSATPDDLIAQLCARGVEPRTAHELVQNSAEPLVREKIAFFDWLVQRRDKRVSSNPPGFLVAAIRKDYPLPRDYLRAMKRWKPVAASNATEQVESRSATPTVMERRVCDPAKKAIDEYLASLKDEELAKLEAAALSRAEAVLVEGYHRSQAAGGQVHAAYRRMLWEREALRILDAQAPRKAG